jgi:uncharacterized protein YecE (DUF72 family)
MIYVGTCGYAYKEWTGAFYPPTIRQDEMLRYYAQCFNAVEIDASYYGILSSTTIARMNVRTAADFRFCFKVPQTVTHPPDVSVRVHTDAGAFVESVDPILQAGKFGAALMQFPNAFKPTAGGKDYLHRVIEALQPLPLVAEFRNRDWQNGETLQMLCDSDVGWCNVDMPAHESLLHAGSDVTCATGYVRFHGRNAEQWWKGDNTSRYDYDYTEEQLVPWCDRIAEMDAQTQATYAFFNNHARGNAARNAETFVELLRERYGQAGEGVIPHLRPRPRQQSLFDAGAP